MLAGRQTVHPFPARMAPPVMAKKLMSLRGPLEVLDPMMGSGTTLLAGLRAGHHVTGVDTDPLAVMIANVAGTPIDVTLFERRAAEVMARVEASWKDVPPWPRASDMETRTFVEYWFDENSARQLRAVTNAIGEVEEHSVRRAIACAVSRTIIVKDAGVSRARDVAHSRPHRTYNVPPYRLVELLPRSVRHVSRVLRKVPRVNTRFQVHEADARELPFAENRFDIVLTSPPYGSAIDYMRAHKFSLIWFGHSIGQLRRLRGGNIGTERGTESAEGVSQALEVDRFCDVHGIAQRYSSILNRYAGDLRRVISEIQRVLRPGGAATVVVAPTTIRGATFDLPALVQELAQASGLSLKARLDRPLDSTRRALPPPRTGHAALDTRMRFETILDFIKA
ncbi:MAG: hypothetical protein GY906_22260 [bacterium]|nr:hypothetical protein [bacterium]